jgi:hypothetical protein
MLEVLSGLRTHLMEPELFKEFCDESTREVNLLRIERSADINSQRKGFERVQRDLNRAIQAILDEGSGAQLKDKIGSLEARRAELTELLANAEEPPLLHPNMAEIYRQRIVALNEPHICFGSRPPLTNIVVEQSRLNQKGTH